jgi:hypothetical protein
MVTVSPQSRKTRADQLRWGWSGVSKLERRNGELRLQHLVAMLPKKQSGDAAVLAHFIEFRARFDGWLHQDEFGPSRGEQTAALRALRRSVRELLKLLENGTPRSRDRLDAGIRQSTDALSTPVALLGEAAMEIGDALVIAGAKKAGIGWLSKLACRAQRLAQQIATLDDNTYGELAGTALPRNIEEFLANRVRSFGLADIEGWLLRYLDLLDETLRRLNTRRGAQERVSLKLLVEELCQLWEYETGLPAAAHGIVRDSYTHRVETHAGRFVTAAVEAMLPDKSWFDQHARFARTARAKTFLPDDSGNRCEKDRARQILVIMRNFAFRRRGRS